MRTAVQVIKRACKPSSVVPPRRETRMVIYLGHRLPDTSCSQPERCEPGECPVVERGGPPLRSYSALHRMGFAVPTSSPRSRWALTPPFHPCPLRAMPVRWRSTLCCTFRRVTPPGCYPASCPEVLGLSSSLKPRLEERDHPTHLKFYTAGTSSFQTVIRPQFSHRITLLIRRASTSNWGDSWRKQPPHDPFLISTTATPPLTIRRIRL